MAKKMVEVEVDEEVEVVEAPKKRQAPTGSTLPSVQPIGEDEIGAPEVAKMLGIEAREFRAFLRTKRDMDTQKGTRYAWKKGSKAVEAIMAEYKAYAANKPVKEPKATKNVVKAKAKKEAAEAQVIDTEIEVDEVDEISIEDLDI